MEFGDGNEPIGCGKTSLRRASSRLTDGHIDASQPWEAVTAMIPLRSFS